MIRKIIAAQFVLLILGSLCASLITLMPGNSWNVASAQTRKEGVQLQNDLKPDYAVDVSPSSTTRYQTSRSDTVNLIFQLIAGSLIYVAAPIAVIIIAVGGLFYVISHGDPTKMEEAKKTITYAVVGLIVIILSWAIMANVVTILSL